MPGGRGYPRLGHGLSLSGNEDWRIVVSVPNALLA